MKSLLVFAFIFLCVICTQLHAKEEWGDVIEDDKLHSRDKYYKLQAQLLCNYLKENSFLDFVNNRSYFYKPDLVVKRPKDLYLKASKAVDKTIETTCKEAPMYGNIIHGIWNTLSSICTVKNLQCLDDAQEYRERMRLVSKSSFAAMNFFANPKAIGSSEADCSGHVSNTDRSNVIDKDVRDLHKHISNKAKASKK